MHYAQRDSVAVAIMHSKIVHTRLISLQQKSMFRKCSARPLGSVSDVSRYSWRRRE